MEDNLPELRDIHLPSAEISIFPLAYGWWLLPLLLIAAVLLVWLVARRIRKSKKRYALGLLEQARKSVPAVRAAIAMSEILRRICVYKYPEAATLYGKNWIAFLNLHSAEKLDGRAAVLLADAPYIGQGGGSYTAEDTEALYRFCHRWIGENL